MTQEIKLPPLPSPFGIVDPSGANECGIYDLKDLHDYAKAYATAAIEADRKTTEKQLTAYRGLVNSLEARLTHLQAQHDELKKSTNPDLLASERAANAMLTEELEADRKAPDDTVLTCDSCGVICQNPWHTSHGENRHVHLCDACYDADRKRRGEPVAWISDSPTKGNGKRLFWAKTDAWRWSSNVKPLYTSPQTPL